MWSTCTHLSIVCFNKLSTFYKRLCCNLASTGLSKCTSCSFVEVLHKFPGTQGTSCLASTLKVFRLVIR